MSGGSRPKFGLACPSLRKNVAACLRLLHVPPRIAASFVRSTTSVSFTGTARASWREGCPRLTAPTPGIATAPACCRSCGRGATKASPSSSSRRPQSQTDEDRLLGLALGLGRVDAMVSIGGPLTRPFRQVDRPSGPRALLQRPLREDLGTLPAPGAFGNNHAGPRGRVDPGTWELQQRRGDAPSPGDAEELPAFPKVGQPSADLGGLPAGLLHGAWNLSAVKVLSEPFFLSLAFASPVQPCLSMRA